MTKPFTQLCWKCKENKPQKGSTRTRIGNIVKFVCKDCNKLARICNGDPFYHDSWHDVSGYARLVEIELEKL